MLQVTLFGTLQSNLSALDFSCLLPDVMTIADTVDSQLTQAMVSYLNAVRQASGSIATYLTPRSERGTGYVENCEGVGSQND